MRFRGSAAVFLIAASQVHVVADSLPRRSRVAGVLRAVNLPASSARTLVVSLGTRRSFVVIPFAPALTDSWNIAVAVIVPQSLIELWGMAAYVWAVPTFLPRARRRSIVPGVEAPARARGPGDPSPGTARQPVHIFRECLRGELDAFGRREVRMEGTGHVVDGEAMANRHRGFLDHLAGLALR
jgi:hypothetical protein